MESDQKITQTELYEMFGNELPPAIINLIWDSPGDITIAEVRRKVREIAASNKRIKEQVKANLLAIAVIIDGPAFGCGPADMGMHFESDRQRALYKAELIMDKFDKEEF